MINAEINKFIDTLLAKTERNELNWKPATLFLEDVNCHNYKAAAMLSLFSNSDFSTLFSDDSFYLNNGNQYLFLLHIADESGEDGTITESWGLYAILDLTLDDTFITIPDYHPSNVEDRVKKISSLIKTNKAADEEKRLLDFFNSII